MLSHTDINLIFSYVLTDRDNNIAQVPYITYNITACHISRNLLGPQEVELVISAKG